MKNQLKVIGISAVISLLTGFVCYRMATADMRKIAVVDAVKLFNGYKMKLDMESQDASQLTMIRHQVDSLERAVDDGKKQQLPEAQLQDIWKTYNYARSVFENAYQQSNTRINEAVWKRLNPLIDEYSIDHHYQLVIGANGMGSVLYNDAIYDRTEDIIRFVNSKYEQNK